MSEGCTLEFDLDTNSWRKVNDDNLGSGGELILGKGGLFFMGGFDFATGNKSKAIFEYRGPFGGWKKWKRELPVAKEALNAWDVFEIGTEFCDGRKNLSHNHFETFKFPKGGREAFKHLFQN